MIRGLGKLRWLIVQVWSSEIDGMSMTSGLMDDGVVALLERPSCFLIFLIAFACIFVWVDVDMALTARWK